MTEQEQKQKETILKLLSEKSVMKQDVFSNTIAVFNELKEIIKHKADELTSAIKEIDKRVTINYKDVTPQSAQFKIGRAHV